MYRVAAALLFVGLGACTITHPLDSYGEDFGAAKADAGDDRAADAAPIVEAGLDAGTIDDAGCVGDPVILEPAPNAAIGATMRMRVSAPSCIADLIVYIDSKDALHVTGSALDQTFPMSVGTHRVNVNGWAHTDKAHVSPIITVTRAQ